MTEEPIDQYRTQTAQAMIQAAMASYGNTVNANTFPSCIDGLKHSQRICIIGTIAAVRSTEPHAKARGANAIGETRTLHPHGEAAVYDTMVGLASRHIHELPPLEIGGTAQTYDGEAAASRYIDIGLSPSFMELYADLDPNVLPYTVTEDNQRYPANYIPAAPMALVMGYTTVAVGYNGMAFPRSFAAVCELTIAYIQHRAKHPLQPFPIKKYAKLLLPAWCTPNTILNEKEVIEKYEDGNFAAPVLTEGTVDITKNSIVLKTIRPGLNYLSDWKETLEAITRNQKEHPFLAERISSFNARPSGDMSELEARTIMEVSRANPFEVWAYLRKQIPFQEARSQRPHYIGDDAHGQTMTPLQILDAWYFVRSRALRMHLERRLADVGGKRAVCQALMVVVDYIDEVIGIMRNEDHPADVLRSRFELTRSQALRITELKFSFLQKQRREALQNELIMHEQRIEELRKQIMTIPELMIDTLRRLSKKYGGQKNQTSLGHYIGYVQLYGRHVIQIASLDEIPDILSRFKDVPVDVVLYPDKPKAFLRVVDGGIAKYELTKITEGDIFAADRRADQMFTAVIRPNGNVAVVRGMVAPMSDGSKIYHVPNNAIQINKDRSLERVKLTDAYLPRKRADAVGVMSNALCFLPDEPVLYVATLSEETPGDILIQRITENSKKFVIGKKVTAMQYSRTGVDWFISIPQSCRRKNTKTLYRLNNAADVLKTVSSVKISLGTNEARAMFTAIA